MALAWAIRSLGAGSADISCSSCVSGPEGGGSGYLNAGWRLNPQTRIGAEFDLWTRVEKDATGAQSRINFSDFVGTVTYYPSPRRNFFVKLGGGAAFTDVVGDANGVTVRADLGTGFGMIVGGGYDLRIGRRVSLPLAVGFWQGFIGEMKVSGRTVSTGCGRGRGP